jgi:acyl carrier protein
MTTLQISENELWLLSYYRESELAGALIFGRLARETEDDELRARLTEHCAEEAQHAWLWTQCILRVGGEPRRVAETYQSRYLAAIGRPGSLLEILALTQVFERRVIRHFRQHLRRPGTHPVVVETLERMIADEVGHIGWVKARLESLARERGDGLVRETMRRYAAIDRRIYAELLTYRDRMAELADGRRRAATAAATYAATDPLAAQVRRTVATALDVTADGIRGDSSLRDLGADSLDLVVLVMALEEAFQVELEPAELDQLRTFDDLVQRIGEGRAVRGAA